MVCFPYPPCHSERFSFGREPFKATGLNPPECPSKHPVRNLPNPETGPMIKAGSRAFPAISPNPNPAKNLCALRDTLRALRGKNTNAGKHRHEHRLKKICPALSAFRPNAQPQTPQKNLADKNTATSTTRKPPRGLRSAVHRLAKRSTSHAFYFLLTSKINILQNEPD